MEGKQASEVTDQNKQAFLKDQSRKGETFPFVPSCSIVSAQCSRGNWLYIVLRVLP